ncbi:putative nucleotide-diphospho-sugar transferase [Daejeonella oryzae]|uniref:putative nucleotide-diphospho-sugar transferase n=1 Tax=Daejeonella oryzae TaxID=1122943 RepID=UPI00138B0478|nr:putative nucleotide-diphospho-sugar transferase [Daejeonella oryzae]
MLYSIYKNANDAEVYIFYQNINSRAFGIVKSVFPRVKFRETDFNLEEKYQRRGSKMLFWELAANELLQQGHTNVCFMDVDTLVLKDISHFFNEKFDIAFSIKNEKWPLNTGVMLFKLNSNVLSFMQKWKEQSLLNIRNPENYLKAKSHDYPYGGPDQMAFHTILSFQKDTLEYNVNGTLLKGFDSKFFNETRSVRITEHTHIIHYKGGWQKVILQGGTFSKKRTLSDSKEMYILYVKMAEEALDFVKSKADVQLTLSEFGISKPSYLNKSYEVNYFKYSFIQFCANSEVIIKSYFNSFINKVKKF